LSVRTVEERRRLMSGVMRTPTTDENAPLVPALLDVRRGVRGRHQDLSMRYTDRLADAGAAAHRHRSKVPKDHPTKDSEE
jgi:hypothetical protein